MNQYLRDICKIGQGRECCRYLTAGPDGFCCEKLSSMKSHLDHATHMTARGDNCDGLVEVEYRTKLREENVEPEGNSILGCFEVGEENEQSH